MSLVELAKSIYENACLIEQQAKANGIPEPVSVDDHWSLATASDDATTKTARDELLQQTRLLHSMAQGPLTAMRCLQCAHLDMVSLEFIETHKIYQKVPKDGGVSFETLSSQCSVPLPYLKRILRQAMTNFIFAESKGEVIHTVLSRHIRDNPYVQCHLKAHIDESWRTATRVVDAVSDPEGTESSVKSAWGLENNATMPFFQELETNHPERAANFARLMVYYSKFATPEPTIKNYDWASLPPNAKVVDVGGGKGDLTISLAKAFPELKFVVQDLPDTVAQGEKEFPDDMKERVSFTPHNFFEPQPEKDADVYFFRAVFHNWTDRDCVRILENLIPGLKKGARIVIHDPYLPEPGTVGEWKNRENLLASMRMMIYFNSYDRNEEEWKALLKRADPKFRLAWIKRPDEQATASNMCFLEIIWEG